LFGPRSIGWRPPSVATQKEFFLDTPVAFVDFIIEAMTTDLAVDGGEA
jgi:hypothetical protein